MSIHTYILTELQNISTVTCIPIRSIDFLPGEMWIYPAGSFYLFFR